MINQYTQFQSLLKQSNTDVIEITNINPNGTSTGTTPSGAVVTVIGISVPVGQKAFIKDGLIDRQAPNLTLVTIDV